MLAECELDAFNMVPSPRIIKEIVLVKELGPEGEINFIVGRVPPVR